MPKNTEPWYAEGLRFECQPDCGQCCVNHGDYDYVYFDGDDLQQLARFLGLTVAEFKERYTEMDEGQPVLRMDQPRCPFLEGTRCTVYPVRPTQCRTFPFWDNNLASRASWKRLREFCPGIDRGAVHPLRVIRGHLAEHES